MMDRKRNQGIKSVKTMGRPKNLIFFHLFVTLCFSRQRFCTAQGNSSSGNPCETYGVCGPFGSCDPETSPICSCLPGFDPRNSQEWNAGNWTGGCRRRVPLACDQAANGTTAGRQEDDGFFVLSQMKVTGYSDWWFGPENQCQGRCVGNCSCVAYAYNQRSGCMFWSGTLIDIQRLPTGSSSDLHIRVANSELGGKKESKKIIIVVAVVGLLIIFICSNFFWRWLAKRKGRQRAENENVDAPSKVNLEELPLFRFEELAVATDNFSDSNKLGKGGFGPVYKGKLPNEREIAVKRLSRSSGQGMEEFMNEVLLISKLQHRNLVRLRGCCIENKETMLVYEYMPNKSLDFFLFDPSQEILDWRKRFNIIEGICRGLLYLHRDSRVKIIHRDLKPSNILLDNDWNPKISDFGMARIFGTKQDHVSTVRVVGTYGYMAPEYAMEGKFSEKSDVFSFGVMVLEMATGRRNSSFNYEGSFNLLGHVWKLWNDKNVAGIVDPRIVTPSNREDAVRCIHIGLLCVQELTKDRPSISAVLAMLRSEILELPNPKQPAFWVRSGRSDAGTSSQQSQRSSGSVNNVTISMIDGR